MSDSENTHEHHERTRFVQASFRLEPETQAAIRAIAEAKQITQSSVMRSAAMLLKHTEGLPPNIKLATVDINDSNGPDYYRIHSWVLTD